MGDTVYPGTERAGEDLICRRCGFDNDLVKVGFKAICDRCNSYLHSCVHCDLLERNSMTCRSHTTEEVGDREGNNYCEEFIPLTHDGTVSHEEEGMSDAKNKFKKLFGDDD